jgi:hypothetical protein
MLNVTGGDELVPLDDRDKGLIESTAATPRA